MWTHNEKCETRLRSKLGAVHTPLPVPRGGSRTVLPCWARWHAAAICSRRRRRARRPCGPAPQVGEPLPGTHVHVTCRPTAFTVEIAAAKKRKGKGRCERVRDRPPYASVQHTSEYDRRFGGRLLHGLCGDGSCALRRGFQPLTFSSRSHADRCAAHSGAVAAACSRGCLHFLRENCINSFIS